MWQCSSCFIVRSYVGTYVDAGVAGCRTRITNRLDLSSAFPQENFARTSKKSAAAAAAAAAAVQRLALRLNAKSLLAPSQVSSPESGTGRTLHSSAL